MANHQWSAGCVFSPSIAMRTSLTALIVIAIWTLESAAVSCPVGTKPVTQELPQDKEERCILERNGKRHGPFQTWYPNGRLRQEGNYRYGQAQGQWTYYYPNGQKRMQGNWRFGKAQGSWTYWHENGVRESTGRFLDGEREGSWTYWDTAGEIRFEGSWTDGKLDLEPARVSRGK
jgi:antitoxin component YwqK of YwqJK toxin-antitoxin module